VGRKSCSARKRKPGPQRKTWDPIAEIVPKLHLPPSQDPVRRSQSSRPTGRKPGGQFGHPGHIRALSIPNKEELSIIFCILLTYCFPYRPPHKSLILFLLIAPFSQTDRREEERKIPMELPQLFSNVHLL